MDNIVYFRNPLSSKRDAKKYSSALKSSKIDAKVILNDVFQNHCVN